MSQPRTGGCLCGAIRYETVGDPVFTLRCHCRDCQRQSGAAHVPAARVPNSGFCILQGTPRRYVTKADGGNEIVRVFCGDCGTPLYVQVATRPDLVGLRVCTLDDPSWFRPEADIFMRSAQPWDHDETGVPNPHSANWANSPKVLNSAKRVDPFSPRRGETFDPLS